MGYRVLIVEDESLLAECLEDLLAREGHDVCGTARSAATALHLAKTHRPDIVFMDVKLAGSGDGIGAAGTILRELGCGVIFLTAYDDEQMIRRMRHAAPQSETLTKPSSAAQISAAIQRVAAGLLLRAHQAIE